MTSKVKRELTYLIQLTQTRKSQLYIMLSHNIQYKVLKLCSVIDSDSKKLIPSGTYASRGLLSMLEGIVELNKFLVDDQVTKTNKLKGITEMIINLDELNNSINLKDWSCLIDISHD